ncbi:unnamed protein product [Linum trigynum]|uniref:Uncharacterized protein n=1 Tax=Linum trigynum TaxID=586398 RepID=A0AAV2E8X8_9ROSI
MFQLFVGCFDGAEHRCLLFRPTGEDDDAERRCSPEKAGGWWGCYPAARLRRGCYRGRVKIVPSSSFGRSIDLGSRILASIWELGSTMISTRLEEENTFLFSAMTP